MHNWPFDAVPHTLQDKFVDFVGSWVKNNIRDSQQRVDLKQGSCVRREWQAEFFKIFTNQLTRITIIYSDRNIQ